MASNNKDEGELVPLNSSSTVSGETRVYAYSGVFVFDKFSIIAAPGQSVPLAVKSLAVDYSKAEKA